MRDGGETPCFGPNKALPRYYFNSERINSSRDPLPKTPRCRKKFSVCLLSPPNRRRRRDNENEPPMFWRNGHLSSPRKNRMKDF